MQTIRIYHPFRFFLIAFVVSWIPWFLAAYCSYQKGLEWVQLVSSLIGLFGPAISAFVMTSGVSNKQLREDIWKRLRLGRIKTRFIPFLVLLMPLVMFVATSLSLFFGQSAQQFLISPQCFILKGQVLFSVFLLFLAPTFEELGWRGYGVDSLRSRYTLFSTTLMFSLLWAMWHLPLFFINGFYQHELWMMSGIYVVNFFISFVPVTILMNWIYFINNRSIIAAVVFHFMIDLVSVLFRTTQFTKCLFTALLFVVALYIMARNKRFFFTKSCVWN